MPTRCGGIVGDQGASVVITTNAHWQVLSHKGVLRSSEEQFDLGKRLDNLLMDIGIAFNYCGFVVLFHLGFYIDILGNWLAANHHGDGDAE